MRVWMRLEAVRRDVRFAFRLLARRPVLAMLAIAVWWPARRAAGIDPQQALRHE